VTIDVASLADQAVSVAIVLIVPSRRRISWLLHGRSFGAKARGCWRCASFAPPVSMALRPTETSGGRRSIELRTERLSLRDVVVAERRPIGSADENVRGAACTIRSARVPVLPGCEIRWVLGTMPRACLPTRASAARKQNSNPRGFRCQRLSTLPGLRPMTARPSLRRSGRLERGFSSRAELPQPGVPEAVHRHLRADRCMRRTRPSEAASGRPTAGS
jgi:hypothetical protein